MTHEVAEEFSPQDPKPLAVKQDGTSVTPASPPPDLEREEEKDDTADPIDLNSCSATYSNLGKWKYYIDSICTCLSVCWLHVIFPWRIKTCTIGAINLHLLRKIMFEFSRALF